MKILSEALPIIDDDPEDEHYHEVAALWQFVAFAFGASRHIPELRAEARRFMDWDDNNEGRTKWYA